MKEILEICQKEKDSRQKEVVMIVSAKGKKKRNVMTFDLGAENTGRFMSVMVESLYSPIII